MNSTQDPFGSLMSITVRPNVVFVRGNGSWLFDSNGKKYFDAVQGWAVNCLGHSPEPLADALCRQAKTLISPSPAYYNQPMIDLASRLTSHSCFDKVFFTNCGAEANEGAVKLARKYGSTDRNGAYEIITFDHSFHGRTIAMMSASGKPQWDSLYEPKVPGFKKAILNDLDSVIALKTDKTVAVMLEPVQGEAGVLPADDSFLIALRKWTRDNGLLLIVDEIQTGMGRTGKLFCYDHSGIEPDVMTLGKGIGGGIPLAALLAKESVCRFQPGDQGGTYNGNPLMTAGGIAVFDVISAPGFIDRVVSAGKTLTDKLSAISKRLGLGATRGRGLLIALDLKRPIGAAIVSRALELGLLLNSPRPDTLRLMPALNITDSEIDALTGLLETAVSDVLKTEKA